MSSKTTSKKTTSPKAKRTSTENRTMWVEWEDGADAAPPAEPIVELDEQVLEADDDATQAPVMRARRKPGRKPTSEPGAPTAEHGAPVALHVLSGEPGEQSAPDVPSREPGEPVADDGATSRTITEPPTPSEADELAEAMAAPLSSSAPKSPPTPAPDAEATVPTTLRELADRYVAHLAAEGKTESTVWGYGMELETAMRFLGDDRRLDALTIADIEAFNASPAVTRTKTGRGKAMPGILKTRRVLRLALVWAVAQGWLAAAPLPITKGAK